MFSEIMTDVLNVTILREAFVAPIVEKLLWNGTISAPTVEQICVG
jgi:hypothetical protein